MSCKCNELKIWLKKEICVLEEIKKDLISNAKLSQIIDAKIQAYTIVLDGLVLD